MHSFKLTHSIGLPLTRSLLVAGLMIVGLQACGNNQIVGDGTVDDVDVLTDEDFTLAELNGQPVSFKGAFVETVSDSLFLIEPTDLEPEGLRELDTILVVNQTDKTFRVPTDGETPLWILGEVQLLGAELLNEMDLTPEQQAELEGQSAVIAESVTLAPSPEQLVENANAFLDQQVTVFGNIELTDNPKTFVVENPGLFQGKGIVVIEGEGSNLFEAVGSERTAVSGVLRTYVLADLEEEYGLTWDLSLREKIEADFEDSPVIISSGVYPVDSTAEEIE
ncbi:hypothetical protein C7271_04185 [filamentous cyanobacterium CCP5]|nr:hypothetical protein C7271_04185 [filamentous cyanobacterium CCP5]